MVEHVYYILTGRKVLLPPKDLDDPLYRRASGGPTRSSGARSRRSPRGSRRPASISRACSRTGSRPTSTAPTAWRRRSTDPKRRAELDDIGLVRMLAPEQVERKVAAIFGERWGRLNEQTGDALRRHRLEGSDRAGRPTRAGRWARSSASCPTTWPASTSLRDFARPAAERRLFPGIEPDVLPGASPEADAAIRQAIVHLHERMLGPLRRRRLRGGRRARSSCSPASSTTPRSRRGSRSARATHCRRATSRTRRATIRTTRSAPGAAW